MSTPPPSRVIDAFLQPVTSVTRRIEIYEADGTTPWKPNLWSDILVANGGSVSANYGEKERRTFECELDNYSGELDPVPGGLWYDKIFKVFYGIDVNDYGGNQPNILIMEERDAPGQAQALRALMFEAGFNKVHYNPDADSMEDLAGFDIVISICGSDKSSASLIYEAFQQGKGVITFGANPGQFTFPGMIASMQADTFTDTYTEFEPTNASMFSSATRWAINTPSAYKRIATNHVSAKVIAEAVHFTETGLTGSPGVLVRDVAGSGGWVHVAQHHFQREVFADQGGSFSSTSYESFKEFLKSTVTHLFGEAGTDYYECQIGEFVSMSIGHANESGDTVSLSCIDYTKRCSDSRLAAATMFEEGEVLEDIVKAVASNCNIRKFNLPVTGETLQRDVTFERDTTRWDVMYKLTSELGYDLYFDGEGRLTMKKYVDPAMDAPNLILKSGVGGNLVSRKLATSDARLFNHVVVVGESAGSSDTEKIPVYAEVSNRDESSPTSILKIGTRSKIETLSTVTDRAKALEVANQLLAVSMLEEFDLSFSSVFFPWIEPGELVEYADETRAHWGPNRYMITSLNLPLDLGPMSGTGKRVVNLK